MYHSLGAGGIQGAAITAVLNLQENKSTSIQNIVLGSWQGWGPFSFAYILCSWHLKNIYIQEETWSLIFHASSSGKMIKCPNANKKQRLQPSRREICIALPGEYTTDIIYKTNITFGSIPRFLCVLNTSLTCKYERVCPLSSQKMQDTVGRFNGLMVFSMRAREQMNSDVIFTAIQSSVLSWPICLSLSKNFGIEQSALTGQLVNLLVFITYQIQQLAWCRFGPVAV